MEWRSRRTSEFAVARGAGGGIHCAPTAEMRPAGVSTAVRGEIMLRNWAGYKDTVRRMEHPLQRHELVASCPDLAQLAVT
mmetsp:Transcript_85754/g.156242  ORF Transcript_85754/g.156242 Transcript_85754/m.156242 type:complete len:80 (-) Transcript_85754:105-344(-)